MIRKEPVPAEGRADATVMVFADVDFISDQVAFQNTPFGAVAANDNHRVLLNAVDYLFGSEELMKVRSKKTIRAPVHPIRPDRGGGRPPDPGAREGAASGDRTF